MTREKEEELTEYERERLAKIERNKALMERLALAKLANDAGLGAGEGNAGGGRKDVRQPGRPRGPREPRVPERQSSRVEKLRKEAALTAWRGTRVETTLRTHASLEVEAEVLCLGTAEEDDRAFGGDLVPRNYFIEGWVGDEPYVAWTDDEGWHHCIWGEDNVKEDLRHAKSDEGGCPSASTAALVILRERARRQLREYEMHTARRAMSAVNMLCESPSTSWSRPYAPVYVDQRAKAQWEAPFRGNKANEYDGLGQNRHEDSVGNRVSDLSEFAITGATYSKTVSTERGRVYILEGAIKDACVACGVSKENTTLMRLGPDKDRSLCNACGLFYVCMGHTNRPKGFGDELNSQNEHGSANAEAVTGKQQVSDEENVKVQLKVVVENDSISKVECVLETISKPSSLPGTVVTKDDDSDADEVEAYDDEEPLASKYLTAVRADVIEDYPLNAVDWDSLPHFTRLVTLAGAGCISNSQVLADEMPSSFLVKRAVPYAAHTHLKRMAMSGRYDKFANNRTLTERNYPRERTWVPDDIDGITLFGYLSEKIQESLEAHKERRLQLLAMEDGDDKRALAIEIANDEQEARRTFDYNVSTSIERFNRAAERAVRQVERELERERRAKEAEEEELHRQAEAELRGQFPVRKGSCDMSVSPGLTEEEIKALDGLEEIPEPINVTCGGRLGVLQTMARPRGERIHDLQDNTIMAPGDFERIAGCAAAKKWKSSLRVLNSDGTSGVSMGTYLFECGDEKGDSIVGRRVAIWWPTEELFFLGKIDSYNFGNGEHAVRYDDGQVEEVMLFLQRIKWLDDSVPPAGEDKPATTTRKFIRPPGVAGAIDATFRVNLGAFDVYARAKPSGTMMKNSERRKCYEILNAIRGVKVDDRMICEPFEKLPSRTALPQYYETIKCPVDCTSIERMLRKSSGGYPSVWYFLVAMELMFTNCKRFNDPAALLYKDAEKLRDVYIKAVAEKFPGQLVPPSITVYDSVDEPAWAKPTNDGVIEDEADPFPPLYSPPKSKPRVADGSKKKQPRYRDSDSDSDSGDAYRPRKSSRRARGIEVFPVDPIQATKYVLARAKGNALPPKEILDILTSKGVKDFENARRPLAAFSALLRQHPIDFIEARGGAVWELAEKVDVYSESDVEEFDERYRSEIAKPPSDKMKRSDLDLCKGILRAIRSCTTKSGRTRSEAFELLPTRKMLPEYYRAISNPIDLGSIQRCLLSGGYPTLWKFLVAIELMLSNCQAYNESKSMLYGDAEALRQTVADEVQATYPGHPLPKRDSPYDAKECEEPDWSPDRALKRPVLKFTMKKPAGAVEAELPFVAPPPCRKCEACDASPSGGNAKECFEIALQRAVHAKQPGALIADRRSSLRSQMIEVYWAPEKAWFRAKVIKYYHARREHTVRYEADDTEEVLQLWREDAPARYPVD